MPTSTVEQKTAAEMRLDGFPVSAGIAIGRLFLYDTREDRVPEFAVEPEQVESEVTRYRDSLLRTQQQVLDLKCKLESDGSDEGAAILDTHLQMLQDTHLTVKIEERIRATFRNAESIFQTSMSELEAKFQAIPDQLFRERSKDIQDISHRVMCNLRNVTRRSIGEAPKSSVVFARELTPSDTAEARGASVEAFVTQLGGETSHAAIIAKAQGIPYVANVDFSGIDIVSGSYVIVDGSKGEVILNPSDDTLQTYRGRREAIQKHLREVEVASHLIAETIDGYRVRVSANVEKASECDMLHQFGGDGVGLFRSEYLFFSRDSFPSEEEQYVLYAELVVAMHGKPVVIRTFDVGGDKLENFQNLGNESNPFLGCRAIRFMLREVEIFKTQLRAILRASALGPVSIMFPMVSQLPEVIEAKKLVREVQDDLFAEGIRYGEDVRIGVMIEVPSAAITCDVIAREVDFLSIGTNDLVQYSLAVDRGNQNISHLYSPAHPGVIRLIRMIVAEGNKNGIPISVCGEVASDPRFTALLLGLGVQELSIAPRFLPIIKNAIRHTSIVSATHLAERVLGMATAHEIRHTLLEYYRRSTPNDLLYT